MAVPADRSSSNVSSSAVTPAGSSPAAGSSSTSTCGRSASAPAMATRLRWPNDSRWVGRSASSVICMAASASATLRRTSATGSPRLRGPKETSWATSAANN